MDEEIFHEPFKPMGKRFRPIAKRFRVRKPFRERSKQYQDTYLQDKLLAPLQFRQGNLVRWVC